MKRIILNLRFECLRLILNFKIHRHEVLCHRHNHSDFYLLGQAEKYKIKGKVNILSKEIDKLYVRCRVLRYYANKP